MPVDGDVLISFKNRDELVKFLEDCREAVFAESGGELTSAELVDRLIGEMQEAGQVTAYGVKADQHLQTATRAVAQLGDTEGNAMTAALVGIGYAIMHSGENAEAFYAAMLDGRKADAG